MHEISSKIRSKNLIITIGLNLIITIGQVIGGIISGSTALLSDALHNFSDVLALVISYVATKLALKKPHKKYTFGLKRTEILAAFINSLTLIIIGVFLCFEAIRRFSQPYNIESSWVILFGFASILLNGISVLILHHDSKHNLNVKSAYIHLFTDMITSVAVMAGGIFMYFYSIYWIDGVLTMLIAIYLIYESSKLLYQSIKVLMLFTPSSIFIDDISKRICTISEIENIHHVHAWQLSDNQIHFEAHIDFNENLPLIEVNRLLENIREILLREFDIAHTTLQPEYKHCDRKDLIDKSH